MAVYDNIQDPVLGWTTAISTGEVPRYTVKFKNAHNPDVGNSFEIISHEGGTYTFPTSDTTMTISSTNANDTVAGTGARVVLVTGLNSDYEVIQETVALNGTTAVTLANQYFRINDFLVVQAGSSKGNVGALYIGYGTVTAGKPATVIAGCHAGQSRDETALYTVPAGKIWIINKLYIGIDTGKTASVRVVRENSGVKVIELEMQAENGLSELSSDYLVIAPEKTDIWIEGKTTTGVTTTIQTISIGFIKEF